ncbi:MAG: Ig-like domain-containing protein [Chloroflexota bacterium]
MFNWEEHMYGKLIRSTLLIVSIVLLAYAIFSSRPAAAVGNAANTRTARPTRSITPTVPRTPTRTQNPSKTPTSTPSATATPSDTPTPVGPFAAADSAQDWQNFSPVAPVVLHFNVPMNTTSTGGEPALLTVPWVDGEIAWSDGATTLTFQPEKALNGGQIYHVYTHPSLKTANGEALNGVTRWTLVAAYGPRVLKHSPAGTLLTRQLNASLAFDRPMDPASVAAALTVQPAIPLTLAWQENTLAITSTQVLTPGLQLAFTLAGEATDLDGVPLGEDYAWQVATKIFSAVAVPVDGAGDTLQVTIRFSHEVDSSSVEAALHFNPPMTGTVAWRSKSGLTFTPADWSAAWSLEEVTFTDTLRDLNGNLLPDLEAIKFVPPVPIQLNGEDQQPSFWIEKLTDPIQITFRLPVDQASVEAAIAMEPKIDGTFRWNKRTLFFQPSQPLAPNTRYQITISPEAHTANGQPFLPAPYALSFQTHSDYLRPGFGQWGANIQVVDANGSRAIQFQTEGGDQFSFSLYRFDLAGFIAKYREHYAISYWYQNHNAVIATEDGELTASWIWTLEQVDERAIIPEVYLPADAAPGLYVLDMSATDGTLLGQLFVVLTENNLVVKWSGDELLAWVSNVNGESVPDTEVRLYSDKGEQIRTGKTDVDGIYRTTLPDGYHPMLVVARTTENDFTLSGLEGMWGDYSPYWWWGRRGTHPAAQLYRAYLYTDRPIYRPGQVVYFKAVTRAEQDVKYDLLPAGTPITIHIRDARDNIVQTFELATNEFGSVHDAFRLADGAMPGTYNVEAVLGDRRFRQGFKVQDYRKPEIQVSIATDAEQYVAGDPLTITVQADYFFGKPVADAKVTVKQYRLEKSYCWQPGACATDWRWFQDSSKVRYTGRTDEDGQVVILETAEYENDKYYWYSSYDEDGWYSNTSTRTWGLEVTVEDGSGQATSGYTVIKVYNTAAKLKLDIGQTLKPSGQPFSITAGAITIGGEPISGTQLTLNLYQWNGKTYHYDRPVITPTLLTTDADGLGKATITMPQNGYYKLNLSGTDARGNALSYNRYVYAYSPGESWETLHSRGELAISAAQTETRPYETVQLTIESTFAGPAMLTFERGRVNRVKPITLTPPLTVVEVEIIPEDAPNIFVTVNAWQPVERYPTEGEEAEYWYWEPTLSDSILRRASVELNVDASDKALNVSIASDQAVYLPRQAATFTMTATNAQGEPVEAELSLAIVDEAIYTLSGELTTPIFEHFYGQRERSVYTYNSMAPYRIIRPSERGGGGGGDEIPGSSPRADFPDTALWLPTLTTDKNGVVTVTVDLPDSLTTWRVVVRAVTKSTLVGEATHHITTQQAVVVRPQLPRVLTVGDAVTLSAFVHNYSDAPLDLFTSIQADEAGLEISGTVLIQVSLAANEVKLVSWQAHALAAGEHHVTVAAFQAPRVEKGRVAWTVGDAVELPLAIQPLAAAESFAEVGTFTGAYTATIVMPPDALERSALTLELSRSPAGSLLEGLEYLTGYPYGCVEQTMSRALPNAVVGRAFEKLAAADTRQQQLEPLIQASVQRLYGYQHNDGGWGWWYDDASHDYQTAWVVFGLSVTAEAGYEVDAQVIQRGVQWLQAHLDEMDVRTRAYALYSMAVAGQGSLAAIEDLHASSLLELDPFSQAALALAYHAAGAAEAAQAILQTLATSATQKNGQVYWAQPGYDGYYEAKTMASTTRSTALVLDAFTQIDPRNPLVPGAVAWLMEQRRPDGWGTTNETAYAILALTDHLQTVNEQAGPTDVQIEINGTLFLTATIAVQEPFKVKIPSGSLQPNINHLSVKQPGAEGIVYYRLDQEIYLPESDIPASGVIAVQRQYLDPKTKQPLTDVQAGELVLVRLQVTLPRDGFYVILEDHLPGGLEALNEKLNNTSHEMGLNTEGYYDEVFFWEDYGYNYKEIYAGRVSFFVTEMAKGKYEFVYLARATRPGSFVTPPVEVYAMYDENLWGRSASGRIAVLAE